MGAGAVAVVLGDAGSNGPAKEIRKCTFLLPPFFRFLLQTFCWALGLEKCSPMPDEERQVCWRVLGPRCASFILQGILACPLAGSGLTILVRSAGHQN